jgi:hypothetical protein
VPDPTPSEPVIYFGLVADVYRNATMLDCTNGGVSAHHDRVLLVGDGFSGPVKVAEHPDGRFEVVIPEGWTTAPYADLPILRLVRRTIDREHLSLEPVGRWRREGHHMFGGNYAATSDSRMAAVSDYPLPIHDRVER